MQPDLIDLWHHQDTEATTGSVVLPDGCRDLIRRQLPGCAAEWFVTATDWSARRLPPTKAQYHGFRLRPGLAVELCALGRLDDGTDLSEARNRLLEAVRPDSDTDDALGVLEHAPSVAAAARDLGVSQRSLQRRVARTTGRSPGDWLRLARVRRAALLLQGPLPLAEVALVCGYADQSHMTNAMRRFLGLSPDRLRARPDLLALLAQPGWGTTAVQSSTSTPCGVAT